MWAPFITILYTSIRCIIGGDALQSVSYTQIVRL